MSPKGAKDSATCHRHPTVRARRKCFSCRRPICPDCQIRNLGHIFCSEECTGHFKREQTRKKIHKINTTTHKTLWGRILFYLPMAVLLAALLALSIWFPEQWIEESSSQAILTPKKRHQAEANYQAEWDRESPLVFTELNTLDEVQVGTTALRGKAPKNAMVGLLVNGRRTDVMLATKGEFSFEEVALTRGPNLIQARAFDTLGNMLDSPAHVLVSLVGAPIQPGPVETGPTGVPDAYEAPPEPAVPVSGRAPDWRRIRKAKGKVALTFDGGSNNSSVKAVLTALRESKVKCTMFLTGEFVRNFPEDVRRILADGHEIANHTLNHPHLTSYSFNERHGTLRGVDQEYMRSQLNTTNALFRALVGEDMKPYWRAPFGERNPTINRWAFDNGYEHIGWSSGLDSLDWVADKSHRLYQSPHGTLRRLLSAERKLGSFDGTIFLFHLGTNRAPGERIDRILTQLIEELRARGVEPTTISDLLSN